MEIIEVESFAVQLADADPDDHRITRLHLTRVTTDVGLVGYGFRGTPDAALSQQVRPQLVGADPMDLETHLQQGHLAGCSGVEQALWDLRGKAAGLPVRELLGSTRDRLPYYLTCVWPGADDQSHLSIEEQVEGIGRYVEEGHRRFKIRIWRPDPMDDVRVVEGVLASFDDVEIMLDRTAHLPGTTWDYATALAAAEALEDAGAAWLEEPFARDDLTAYRRLRDAVAIDITGGEAGTDLAFFRDYLTAGAVDIIQPDLANSGGIWPCRKVGVLAEAFETPCILHGTNGPDLAASLQVAAAIPSCRLMEIALVFPPLTPGEMWAPVEPVLAGPPLFELVDGQIVLPEGPGLGIDLDEDALDDLRDQMAP